MKHKIKKGRSYILLLAVLTVCFMISQQAQAQISLLPNSDFESFIGTPDDGVSDDFSNWRERELTYGNIIEASTDKQAGNYAVKLTSKSKDNPAAIDLYTSLLPSTSYYLEWYGKVASSKGSLNLRIFYYDQQTQTSHYLENSDTNDYMSWNDRGNSLDGVGIDNNDNFYDDDNVWVKRSFVFTTASTPQTYYIYFSATSSYSSSGSYEDTTVAYLDHVTLSKAVLNWDIANDNWPQGSDKIVLNPIQGFENYSAEVSVSRDNSTKYSETIENISASPRTINPNLEDGVYNANIKLREKSSGSLDQEFFFQIAGKHVRQLKELLYTSGYLEYYRDISLSATIKSLNESPYSGFISKVMNYLYDTAPPPALTEFSGVISLIKNNVDPNHKAVWPEVDFNRFCGCDSKDGCLPWVDAAYAGKIKGLDLWNDSGSNALGDFYDLFQLSLRLAKETGSPGIIVDHELYNNYKNSSLAYLVQEIGKPEPEVVSQLEAVGAQLADYTNQIYPDGVLLFYSFKATAPDRSDSYKMSTSYIVEGMLKRAKDQKYSFKVVDGGESLMGYIHPNYEDYRQHLIKQEKSQMNEIYSYPNLELGATLAPYNDLSKSSFLSGCSDWGICDWQAGDGLQTIDDLVPLMKTAFETRKYVWFYGTGKAPYNEYNPVDYTPIRQRINAILDSLSASIKGDLNSDNLVNNLDFGILKNDFLKLTANLSNPKSDIDGDGQATVKDVGIMMSGWR